MFNNLDGLITQDFSGLLEKINEIEEKLDSMSNRMSEIEEKN